MPGHDIRIEQLERRYGDTVALRPLDAVIEPGRWVSLVGPSGSGKSTLLHLLGAMDRPTGGRVLVGGIDLASLDDGAMDRPTGGRVLVGGTDLASLDDGTAARFRREAVGFVFQQHHMVPFLTTLENVMLAQHFHSVADEAEASAALDEVGLGPRARHLPSQLSGGERQRACIARALVNEPGLLLLDEPTGNLDWASALTVLDTIARLQDRTGFTVVCATHNPAVARWSERMLRLSDGKLVSDEPSPGDRPRNEAPVRGGP